MRPLRSSMNYDYPGNIRELRSIIQAASNLAQKRPIGAKHSSPDYLKGRRKAARRAPVTGRRPDPAPGRDGAHRHPQGLRRDRPKQAPDGKAPGNRAQYLETQARLLRGGLIPSMQVRPARHPRSLPRGPCNRSFRDSFARAPMASPAHGRRASRVPGGWMPPSCSVP